MRSYEIMFIVDPNLPEEEIDEVNAQIEKLIQDSGGEVQSIEKMGRRKLAYDVKRRTEGFYVLFSVIASGEIVKEVERRFRVMDAVLRYITVRTDRTVKKLEKTRNLRQRKAARRTGAAPQTQAEPALGNH